MPGSSSRLDLVLPIGADAVAELRESITANADILDNATIYLPPGTLAAMPAASAVPAGAMYYATDAGIVFHAVGTGSSASMWVNGMFTPGDLKCSALAAAPSGWSLCDGGTLTRAGAPFLFAAIGTTFGSGDGSTTFNKPDLRGRVPVGAGTGTAAGASAWALGAQPTSGAGGEEKHALTAGENGPHTHGFTTNNGNANIQSNYADGVGDSQYAKIPAAGLSIVSSYDLTNSGGSGGNTEVAPVSKVFGGGDIGGEWGGVVPNHAHTDAGHHHTGTTDGGGATGAAHNNMQPVSVVNWFIKT